MYRSEDGNYILYSNLQCLLLLQQLLVNQQVMQIISWDKCRYCLTWYCSSSISSSSTLVWFQQALLVGCRKKGMNRLTHTRLELGFAGYYYWFNSLFCWLTVLINLGNLLVIDSISCFGAIAGSHRSDDGVDPYFIGAREWGLKIYFVWMFRWVKISFVYVLIFLEFFMNLLNWSQKVASCDHWVEWQY